MNDATFAPITITMVEQIGMFYGRPCAEHYVCRFHGKSADGVTYEDDIPVILQEGQPWEFGKGNTRTVTEADQVECLKHIEDLFPDFGEIKLSGETIRKFISWVSSGEVTANAKLDGNPYTDKNGVVHNRCKICKPGKLFDTDWLTNLGKRIEKLNAPKVEAKKSAPKPPTPSAKKYTADDAWAAYECGQAMIRFGGDRYWELVGKIVGRAPEEYQSFTSDDWKKCVMAFEGKTEVPGL